MSQATQGAAATGNPPEKTHRGIVKLVQSGDSIIIRGPPRNGPPQEKSIGLSNINAPKLGRRGRDITEVTDLPFAWEAREFLRKMVLGREVQFVVEHAPSSTTRVYGSVWLMMDGHPQNLADAVVSEGFAEVKQTGKQSPEIERLSLLEASAKSAKKGMWDKETAHEVRETVWNMPVEDLRLFVERNHNKEFNAIVEHVRDGSTLRLLVLPSNTMLTVAMSGIKCPQFRKDGVEAPEPLAEQARFFTECRLLQREVAVSLEGVTNQLVYGTISHPAGNIAEVLLKEGFAKCVDWSIAFIASRETKEKLRRAERHAKKEQLRLWKGFTPAAAPEMSSKDKKFTGKVIEVGNADNLVVKTGDKTYQKIFFSSFRAPRPQKEDEGGPIQAPSKLRPLYDIPYMFEAREFLRKKLIGKKVNVVVDYVKPAQDNFPEKTCCTVTREDVNIAEALISKGYGTCLRHKQNDDMRSSAYDDLLSAETRAAKNLKGVHSKKDYPAHRVADISQDPNKAKQFLAFLQRAGKTVALVEFVASGARLRLYLPKDTCLINFILAGVSCPRAPNVRDGGAGEPFGQDALFYTRELVMQKEVEVEVEQCDKGGNFIGWLYFDGKNLSTSLVTEGLCKVLPQAERSVHAKELFDMEEKAKAARKKIWKDYVEPSPADEADDGDTAITPVEASGEMTAAVPERKMNFQKVGVTEVPSCQSFCAQRVEDGPKLEQLMSQMRSDLQANPPLVGSFKPNKGALCIAKFSDGLWYRCKVEKMDGGKVHVLYIDYGNRGVVPVPETAKTPAGYSDASPYAKEYNLACCLAPNEDFVQDARDFLAQEILDKVVYINTEYKSLGQEYVTIQDSPDEGTDIGKKMVSEGLLRAERKKDKRLAKLVVGYLNAEDEARKNRCGMWCYGDATPDDAREFGYQQK